MEETTIQSRIDGIERKLDIILEEMDLQRRRRNELEDLRDDLLRVGNDVYRDTIEELEEFSDTLDPADAILLGKKLLRNVDNIKTAFEQLESARDFLADFMSISGDMFNEVLEKMDEFDRKGYFELMKKSGEAVDAFTSAFTPADFDRLNEAVPRLAEILKRVSKPELVEKLDTATRVFDSYEYDTSRSPGIPKLIGAMTSREVRTGMFYMLGLMKETVKSLEGGGPSAV